jgi:SAM-dependent methyltransferase
MLEVWGLDVGCGENKKEGYLGLDVRRTEGVDVIASAEYLPFANAVFQNIHSRRCLQHLKRDVEALSEIRRVLSDSGRAIVIFNGWWNWVYYFWHYKGRKKPYNLFHFPLRVVIRKKLIRSGFRIFTILRFAVVPNHLKMRLWFLTEELFVIAQSDGVPLCARALSKRV